MDETKASGICFDLISQYRATLEMLRRAVETCPEELWDAPAYYNRFWRVAYHVLFYTDLYLSAEEASFRPWRGHIQDYQFLDSFPWPADGKPREGEPYPRDAILEYIDYMDKGMSDRIQSIDLASVVSGFDWLPFGKGELVLYNLRHLQHHTGQLIERIRQTTGCGVDWVGMGKRE
ncbi:MAG: DinB family protein [Calditrichaeota bacterium]|nr:DinB family protein [Calditrichota bacterium]